MKSDPDTEAPTAASTAAMDVKMESILEVFGASHKSPFLWKNCENENQRDRVDIKQQAVCDGLKFVERILNILRNWQNQNKGIEIPELTSWIRDAGLSQPKE